MRIIIRLAKRAQVNNNILSLIIFLLSFCRNRFKKYNVNSENSESCEYGLSAAPIATNDIVITGSMDGFLEIHRAIDGERIWVYDAWRQFDAVNGVATHGGAFDAHGPLVADNLLIVSAGYSYVGAQRGGNALLVFEVIDDGG